MVVHLIDIRSSGWKVFPKIGSEYFFSEGGFSLEKKEQIEKFRNDKDLKLFSYEK